MNVSPELIAALMGPTAIVGILAWLLKRSISQLDAAVTSLQVDVKALTFGLAHRDIGTARIEEKISALERRIEQLEEKSHP